MKNFSKMHTPVCIIAIQDYLNLFTKIKPNIFAATLVFETPHNTIDGFGKVIIRNGCIRLFVFYFGKQN